MQDATGFEAYDERILGSGEFVEHVWHETELSEAATAPLEPLDAIMERVAAAFDFELSALQGGNKQKKYSDCRAAICFIATRNFGYRGVDRYLQGWRCCCRKERGGSLQSNAEATRDPEEFSPVVAIGKR